MKTKRLKFTFTLLAAMVVLCANIIPFAVFGNVAHAAPPVVPDPDTWVNTYSGNYYDNLNEDLTGSQFRTQLANLITTTHTHLTSYDSLSSHYLKTDYDPNNPQNLIMFYTGTSVKWPGNFSGVINREHVWPKDAGRAFPEKTGPGGDLQHIRPCDNNLNSTRGSKSYDELTPGSSGVKVAAENGSTSYGKGEGLCYTNSTFFYPAKGYRGATARILFYLQTRWGDTYSLKFVDSAGNCKTIGKISTLLKWHLEEPPTDQEILRNNEAAKIQGNRNPFIDHPEYAEMIYCYDGNSYNTALQNVVGRYGSYLDNNNDRPDVQSISLSQSSIELSVGERSQLITVTAIPAGASNGVTWNSNNASVATVEAGIVTAVGEGSATITATSKFNPSATATLQVTVTDDAVHVESLTISPNTVSLPKGANQQLTVTAYPVGASNSVRWESKDDRVATVTQGGLVSAVGVGNTSITATSTENPQVFAAINITVTDNTVTLQSLSITPSALSLDKGAAGRLTVTASPAGASNSVTWSSDKPTVAEVSSDGVVTAVASGTAVITATSTIDGAIKATATVTVKRPAVSSLTITPNALSLVVGAAGKLSATCSPVDADSGVKWSSNNPTVATVDGNGVVTAVSAGSAVIRAESTADPSVFSVANVTVREAQSIVGIQIGGNPAHLSYKEGQQFNPEGLTVTVLYNDGTSEVVSNQSCLWLDATTRQQTLSAGTTGVICKYGEIEQRLSYAILVEQAGLHEKEFLQKAEAINSASSLQERFEAIKQAINSYSALSDEEKVNVADAYQAVKQAAIAYNNDIALRNAEFADATNLAAQFVVKAIPAALALAVILGLLVTRR